MNVEKRARIRVLNDLLRQHYRGGRLVLSRGVAGLGADKVYAALAEVAKFEAFEASNDPNEEHSS